MGPTKECNFSRSSIDVFAADVGVVHDPSAGSELGIVSNDDNCSLSNSSSVVVAVFIGGDVVDKIHCVRKLITSLLFAAFKMCLMSKK